MSKLKLRGKDLIDIGYPQNKSISIALDIMKQHYKKETKPKVLSLLKEVLDNAEMYIGHGMFGKISEALLEARKTEARMLNHAGSVYHFW